MGRRTFDNEVVPVQDGKNLITSTQGNGMRPSSLEKLSKLRPAFDKKWNLNCRQFFLFN